MDNRVVKHIVLSLAFTLLVTHGLTGQYCGTLSTPVPENYLADAQLTFRGDEVDTVGLAVWVIENSIETHGLYDQFEQSLLWVNEKYSGAGLYFFICEWNEENGEGRLDRFKLDALNKARFQDHRLNVYLVQDLVESGFQLAGFGIFPWDGKPEDRYVAMVHDEIEYPQLIAHEFGHYYGLLHTHDHSKGYETVLRTNCQTAGDLCCDTPADPGLGFFNMDGCNYTGSQTDNTGLYYFPLTDFIMSYAPFECIDKFSFEQLDRMRMTAQVTYPKMVHDCSQLPDIALSATTSATTIDFLDTLHIDVNVAHTFTESQWIDLTLYLEQIGDPDFLVAREMVMLDPVHPDLTYTLQAALPPGISDGTRNLKIKADANRNFIESDERNNLVNVDVEIDNSRFRDAVLFPNPAEDAITLFFRKEILQDEIQMRMTNAAGQSIGDLVTLPLLSPYYTKLSVDHLVAGMYFLFFMTGKDVVEVVPFVKI